MVPGVASACVSAVEAVAGDATGVPSPFEMGVGTAAAVAVSGLSTSALGLPA